MIYCNRCFTASISDRNYELIEKYAPNIIENGGVLPADLSDETLQSVADVVGRAARSLGIINGSVKGDIVLSAQGPVVIEMAARLSGGYLCTDQIPLARGVDLVKQVIKLALGEELDISELNPIDVCKMGIRYFFPEPGRIVKIQGFDELDQYEWVSKKMLFLKEGDIVEFPSNHTKRAGFVHVTAETFEDAEERAVFAANSVNFETVPV